MSASSVIDLRQVRENPVPHGRPAHVTGAILGAKRTAFAVSVGSGGTARSSLAPAAEENAEPVLVFADLQTASEPAGEMPRAAPGRRRICTTIRLDAERRRRLGLVASFTGRSTQAVIVAALQDYLRDLIPCPAAMRGRRTRRGRSARAFSPARGSRRSLRLHPHLYWRLAIAARKARCSMQSILACALDSHLGTVAPDISAEVFSCLMGWTDTAGVSAG